MDLKVFISNHCLDLPSGILFGSYLSHKHCYCIVEICTVEQYKSLESGRLTSNSSNDGRGDIIGLWVSDLNLSNYEMQTIVGNKKKLLIVQYNKHDASFGISLTRQKNRDCSNIGNHLASESAIIILYDKQIIIDGKGLLVSQHVSNKMINSESKDSQQRFTTISKPTEKPYVDDYVMFDYEMIHFLYCTVLSSIALLKNNNSDRCGTKRNEFHVLMAGLLNIVVFVSKTFLDISLFMLPPLTSSIHRVMCLSSIGSQIILKVKLLSKLRESQTNTHILHYNIVLALLCDILIGSCLCYLISMSSSVVWDYGFDLLTPSVNSIGRQVEQLIRWLMGIPIGLKLNAHLNQFLGKFFLHHVQLWLEYIQFIFSSLSLHGNGGFTIAWPLYFSCFGFSFFVAFVSDVVSLLTFHIYCFYVYAARLYGLQIAGLMSLWRLFRGKKWNPLRNRVDTLSQDADVGNHRFFTGTLLFTVLLFLLPTTALYYTIFTALRIATILIQNTLFTLRQFVTYFPWYSVILRTARPNAFACCATFNLINSSTNYSGKIPQLIENLDKHDLKNVTIIGLMVGVRSYFTVIWSAFNRMNSGFRETFKFMELFTSVLSGKLLRWN